MVDEVEEDDTGGVEVPGEDAPSLSDKDIRGDSKLVEIRVS